MAVMINGRDLTVEQVIRVCRHDEKVELTPEAVEAVKKARAYVEKKVEDKETKYYKMEGYCCQDIYKCEKMWFFFCQKQKNRSAVEGFYGKDIKNSSHKIYDGKRLETIPF